MNNSRLLRTIKEYKELIAIIVSFIGGALWVFDYFATKEEVKDLRSSTTSESNQLHCLLQENVQRLDGEHMMKFYSVELLKIQQQMRDIKPKSGHTGKRLAGKRDEPVEFEDISERDEQTLMQLEQQMDDAKANLNSARLKRDKGYDNLVSGYCNK